MPQEHCHCHRLQLMFLLITQLATLLSAISAPSPQLSEASIPSLVLLGTAKGGTTDLWHMLHRVHKGFCSYDRSEAGMYKIGQFPEHIQTKKELNFFSSTIDSVCFGALSNPHEGGGSGTSENLCSPRDLSSLLRCPNTLLNQLIDERKRVHNQPNEIASRCREWQDFNMLGE